ncbi:MAG: class I SAM-dependent methyltransferase [Candidatus Krumholzibacteria bacterium]|nr:class I SAM-dependent methyltransferase [Candidatus Krumholzibacteria bacterium]
MERDETIRKVLDTVLSRWPGELSPGALGKLHLFIGEQVKWNKVIHIFGRNDTEKTIADQISDSLAMLLFARELLAEKKGPGAFAGPVIDIGTGFGFPGFVWKIVDDGLPVTLVERKEKAATFLERLALSLKLDGLEIVRRDAEKDEIPGLYRIVTSKAAGRLGKMLPIAAKLLEPGGLYITVKEKDWRWELEKEEAPGMKFLKEETIEGNRGALVAFRK